MCSMIIDFYPFEKARRRLTKQYIGTWHITEMEAWDEDYFNMVVQAYIRVESSGLGHFQFGLVYGQIDGGLTSYQDRERFDFT